MHDEIGPDEAAFIGSRDMFFLSTVDPDGMPTVSYKGGSTGFVKGLDANTLVFPGLDGNGMWYSMGNIEGQSKVGCCSSISRPRTVSASRDTPGCCATIR